MATPVGGCGAQWNPSGGTSRSGHFRALRGCWRHAWLLSCFWQKLALLGQGQQLGRESEARGGPSRPSRRQCLGNPRERPLPAGRQAAGTALFTSIRPRLPPLWGEQKARVCFSRWESPREKTAAPQPGLRYPQAGGWRGPCKLLKGKFGGLART